MKLINLYTGIIIGLTTVVPMRVLAQCSDCDDKLIVTDPRPDIVANCEDATKKNKFFWFPYNGNDNSDFLAYYSFAGGNITATLNSPFWTPAPGPIIGEHAGMGLSDFHPEDGWELLKSDVGYLADNTTKRQIAKTLIYLCFYNRYRGVMRFFGMMPGATNGWEIIRFKIEIPKTKLHPIDNTFNVSNTSLQATNLLSIQGQATQPLDQQTEEQVLEVVTEFPGASPSSHFFWFEIPVAYDPCVCKNDVAIGLTAQIEQNWDLSLEGIVDAKLVQKTTTDINAQNQQYQKLVFNRVIGAAAATGVAIATGGTVIQASKFTDLIDVIKDRPGSTANKARLQALKDLMNTAASNFVYDANEKKWKHFTTGKELTKEDWVTLLGNTNKFLTGYYDFVDPARGGNTTTTSVLGKITATGSANQALPTNALIFWGLPGSKMSKNLGEELTPVDVNSDNIADYYEPEYPLYNKPLGTLALIKTPEVARHLAGTKEICDEPDLTTEDPFDALKSNNPIFTLQLKEDLKFYFNPALNINTKTTKIHAAFVISIEHTDKVNKTGIIGPVYNPDKILVNQLDPTATRCFENLNSVKADIKPINMGLSITEDEYISTFVPIEYFREFAVKFVADKNFTIFDDRVFIRVVIEFESNDIAKSGKPVRNTQVFTFPVKLIEHTGNPIEVINLQKDGEDKNYISDIIFTSGDDLIYSGKVTISSKLSTATGVKKKIYAIGGFEMLPGAEISPDIELIVGYPFQGLYPQNQMTQSEVMSFCSNQNATIKYRANQFASAPPPHDTMPPRSTKSKTSKPDLRIHPNPSSEIALLDIFSVTDGTLNIAVLDMQGREVYRTSCMVEQGYGFKELNVSRWPEGIYLVAISGAHGRHTEKLMVQRK
jgi:hypothetical protein